MGPHSSSVILLLHDLRHKSSPQCALSVKWDGANMNVGQVFIWPNALVHLLLRSLLCPWASALGSA